MSVRDKWVRRFSIDETAKHKNGFTIYKITSVLFPLGSPEAVTVVSVWKRYSDVQQLHKSMKSLHAGLHLRGTFPTLAKSSYFKRFHQEVIDERARTIKILLEFIAEHRLLFASTDFVNFLQTGYPEPETKATGVINTIRSSLHLPIEETPPLEYQTSDDEARSPSVQITTTEHAVPSTSNVPTEIDVSQIPIYEAADVEIRESPKTSQKLSDSNSFESINSIDSLDSDLYDELSKVTIDKTFPSVKKNVLPDLINFDVPSTSKFEDYHTMPNTTDSDNVSLASTVYDSSYNEDRGSRMSLYSKRSALSLSNAESKTRTDDSYALSLSNVESKTRTEDSYVFEAGYMLNLAARCEDMGDYQRAFECYKSGIEKMLIGVQTDPDPQRRALVKEKTNKYLSYAEAIYSSRLCGADQSLLPERDSACRLQGIPLSMLQRPYEELAQYRVLSVLGGAMLVLRAGDQACYAMKVVQKIPNNLTEFDDYFQQRNNETRQVILPTVIPYMVPLHAYVETNNLIFLILAYAPGEKLFDYIKNYAKSIPNTPARELNLENVFAEPKKKDIDIQNDNIDVTDSIAPRIDKQSNIKNTKPNINITDNSKKDTDDVNENEIKTDSLDNSDVSVNQLVINSQKLLMNVDKALTDVPQISQVKDHISTAKEDREREKQRDTAKSDRCETPNYATSELRQRSVLPPAAVCRWGAQLLTALEGLHRCGVVCRDLHPGNILLGARGQLLLTYTPGLDAHAARARLWAGGRGRGGGRAAHVAPELWAGAAGAAAAGAGCDYWSFGAIIVEIKSSSPVPQPLSRALPPPPSRAPPRLPAALPVEARSLLTQLLTYEPSERLGCGKDGIEEIKRHPYFKHIDWDEVRDAWCRGLLDSSRQIQNIQTDKLVVKISTTKMS
ncbi:unnamed protein product, partial [Brenthis ino]